MIKVGQFPIGSNSRYWYIGDGKGGTIRRFTVGVWTLREVQTWRHGYVAGLNAR
jgi:hypothetical protein